MLRDCTKRCGCCQCAWRQQPGAKAGSPPARCAPLRRVHHRTRGPLQGFSKQRANPSPRGRSTGQLRTRRPVAKSFAGSAASQRTQTLAAAGPSMRDVPSPGDRCAPAVKSPTGRCSPTGRALPGAGIMRCARPEAASGRGGRGQAYRRRRVVASKDRPAKEKRKPKKAKDAK